MMASKRQLLRALPSLRSINPCKTLPSLPSHRLQLSLLNGSFRNRKNSSSSHSFEMGSLPQFYVPALLASLFGIGMIDVAYADSEETNSKPLLPPQSSPIPEAASKMPSAAHSSPSPSHNELEEIAKKERVRLENLLRSKGGQTASYPRFTVAVKGPKVTIKFQVPPAGEIPLLIANLVSRLGVKVDDGGSGTDMVLRAWDSGVAWQLTLSRPAKQNEVRENEQQGREADSRTEDLCILFFRPLIGSNKAEVEFMKSGHLTSEELDALVALLHLAGQRGTAEPRSWASDPKAVEKTVSSLEGMGVKIFGLTEPNVDLPKGPISWENLAGYDQQKREIEDTILLVLQSPQIYDDIARGTRCKFESNRPRAVLFEGPPGTGKTSSARVIANQAGVPLLYVPLEIIMSKYYGESERLLGKVFSLANDLPNGAIVFLDEVDSFAVARDGETHEATRRILSVLLRQIDGFEQEKKVVVVAATNRKEDLDPALISRFDSVINFCLPDHRTRQEIAAQYAKHLTKAELDEFARVTEDMSGRDIKDVCQQAERHWASKLIRGQAERKENRGLLPTLQEYIDSAIDRQRALLRVAGNNQQPNLSRKRSQFDFV